MTFQPKTYFSVQWTAYMIFMVLVGGIGRFEGAILGALIFFLIETWFGGTGVWYLIGLGATAVLFSLLLPRGLWGAIEQRFGLSLLPVGYRLVMPPEAHDDARRGCIPQAFNREDRKRMTMLLGKSILITGVASGIGARTAELACQLGADVIGVDMRRTGDARGRIRQRRHLDQGRRRRAGVAAAEPLRRALQRRRPVGQDRRRADAWRSISTGCARLSEAMAPRLREGGAIVNVASIAGFGWRANLNRAISMVGVDGFPDVARVVADHDVRNEEGYPVSKELLLLWTFRAAHQKLFKDRGIRVNAVSPGPVETPILTQFREVLGDARVDSDIARVGRAGTAGDIAPVVLFLCSDAARWINGANVPVDGGLEASVNAEVLGF